MKSQRLIFKAEVLIYQSKDNLDVKILLGKVTHLLDSDTRKMLLNG